MSAAKELSLGARIDEIYALKQQKRELEERAEEMGRRISAAETDLLEVMEESGTQKATGLRASASITESVVPQVEDWDEFYKFIRRNNAFELLQRRPAVEAWREHAAARREQTVPGTVPYIKRQVSVRVSK